MKDWIMQLCPEIAEWQAKIIYEQVRIRVNAELERCKATCAVTSECWRADADRWAAQRDALLEALKTVEWHGAGSCWVVDADKIAAAIAKAEENNT